jgi:hypothetical protein
MNRALRVILAAAVALVPLVAAGCQPYRVEYRRRPPYYSRMVDEPLPERVEMEDGTVLVYTTDIQPATGSPDRRPAKANDDEKPKRFQMREEMEDGSIVLRAFLPEHVIVHALNCLRYEEYELLWDQMIAEQTKLAYEAEGKGYEEFAAFFRKHRLELAKMLNRMRLGMSTHETVVENVDGVIECRFWPQVAVLFEFKTVKLVREGWGLKLLMIE